ncbi:MAG TPA: glutathione S-transferase family protein [Candidatus Udaeobacter sp.]|nr:glutathione S-transferase family protein [Candidatus Udaeobacter sp.]
MARKPARSKKPVANKAAKPMAKKAAAKKTARPAAARRKAAKPMLHGIAFSGPTYKVALMFALSGEPFAYKHMDMRAGAHKAPEYLAINRYGQVPAVIDGALRLCQSGAILQYLADKFGKFGGKNAEERARAREWLFWDADRLAPGIFRSRAVARGFLKLDPGAVSYFRDHGEQGLKVLEAELGKSPFVAGKAPTIGDIACYGVLAFAKEGEFDLSAYPNIGAWMDRMQSLKGFKGPYDLLPLHDIA